MFQEWGGKKIKKGQALQKDGVFYDDLSLAYFKNSGQSPFTLW